MDRLENFVQRNFVACGEGRLGIQNVEQARQRLDLVALVLVALRDGKPSRHELDNRLEPHGFLFLGLVQVLGRDFQKFAVFRGDHCLGTRLVFQERKLSDQVSCLVGVAVAAGVAPLKDAATDNVKVVAAIAFMKKNLSFAKNHSTPRMLVS